MPGYNCHLLSRFHFFWPRFGAFASIFRGRFCFSIFLFLAILFFFRVILSKVLYIFNKRPYENFTSWSFFFRGRAEKRKSREARNGCICTFYVSQQIDSAFRTFCCNVSGLEFGLGKNGERCWIRFVD